MTIYGCCKRVFSSVSGVSDICFKYYLDVAKVDLDVAYVEMAIYACCKSMFQVFHVFETYVVSVSSGCYNMLLWLYTHVSSVHVKCFKCLRRML